MDKPTRQYFLLIDHFERYIAFFLVSNTIGGPWNASGGFREKF
jgi:hypothetical protein